MSDIEYEQWLHKQTQPLLAVPEHATLRINWVGRDFFVGDLHGQLAMLQKLLAHVGFDEERDRLICVGDFIDRGAEAATLLQMFNNRPLYSVLGNHEAMYIYGDSGPFDKRVYYRRDHHLPSSESALYIEIARHMPLTLEVPLADGRRIGVVHAEVGRERWDELRLSALQYRHVHANSADVVARALQGRDRIRDLRLGRRPTGRTHIYGIDLVICGHSNLRPGWTWRYGNQIGLESLAFDKCGAMTLFEPAANRYWRVWNATIDPVLTVNEIRIPTDLDSAALIPAPTQKSGK